MRHRLTLTTAVARRAVLAASVLTALTLTACTSSATSAVDPLAGIQFRFVNATTQGEVIAAAERKAAGPVGGPLLSGSGTYRLSQDAGKVVVINLWATWCNPCVVETPEFNTVYGELKAQGVNFVGFAVKNAPISKPQEFVKTHAIDFPMVYDEPAKVALQLGNLPVQGLPLTVLIDRRGRVAAVYVGLVQPSRLKPAIAALVAEPAA